MSAKQIAGVPVWFRQQLAENDPVYVVNARAACSVHRNGGINNEQLQHLIAWQQAAAVRRQERRAA